MVQYFIYPCNTYYFNIIDHFSSNKEIVWRSVSNIKNDDIVFIYVGKTYHEIRYKCKVISEDISDITLMENQYAIPKGKISNRCCYVKMKLIREYPKNTFPLSDLKKYGMGQFMVPMRANETILRYLLDKEKNLDWGDE